jgi:hypothetical protein
MLREIFRPIAQFYRGLRPPQYREKYGIAFYRNRLQAVEEAIFILKCRFLEIKAYS